MLEMILWQELSDPNSGLNERALCWDEENRLSATRDNIYVTANIYDASGNRAWTLRRGSAQALAGEMNWMWQNGSGWQGYGDLNLRTWYQSELMTITDVGFTKHYFIAGQRIASKLGESLNNADVQPLRENHVEPLTENYKVLNQGAAERMKRDFECLGLDYNNFTPGEPVIRVLDELAAVGDADESNIYFYHSDHASAELSTGLGSSSFLTDGGGVATQHLQYTRTELVECVPFGEDFGWSLSPVEGHQQNTAAYYTPYTFSGKERDMEMRSIREDLKKISTTEQTGLSYFGARYYDAGLSIWLSVDPMSDKYPYQSAFTYCGWNPLTIVDPDGREEFELDKKSGAINKVSDTRYFRESDGSITSIGKDIEYAGNGTEVDKLKDQKGREMYVTAGILGKSTSVGNEESANKATFYNFGNSNEANDFYKFAARGSDVEWGYGRLKSEHGGGGIVGTSGQPGHSAVSGILEMSYGDQLDLLSHSHPTGGAPSFNLPGPKNTKVGDLNSAFNSKHQSIVREVFDVPNNLIYTYSSGRLNKAM